MRIVLAMVFLGAYELVFATGMMESDRQGLDIQYENGDRLNVLCEPSTSACVLRLLVRGRHFQFTAKQLGVPNLYPDNGRLYSGSNSGGAKYFSFSIGAECPEQHDGAAYECDVSAAVEDGKLSGIGIGRTREEHVSSPSK